MLSLSDNNQTNIIEAFNSTSRYLDDSLKAAYSVTFDLLILELMLVFFKNTV